LISSKTHIFTTYDSFVIAESDDSAGNDFFNTVSLQVRVPIGPGVEQSAPASCSSIRISLIAARSVMQLAGPGTGGSISANWSYGVTLIAAPYEELVGYEYPTGSFSIPYD